LARPEVRYWPRRKMCAEARVAGGCVVQAHPFRQRSWIKRVVLSSGCVDAVEAANMGNDDPAFDALAMRYARALGLPVTAGTDIHDAAIAAAGETFGTILREKPRDCVEFARAISGGGIVGIKASPGRCEWRGDESVSLPVELRDKRDREIPDGWKNFYLRNAG